MRWIFGNFSPFNGVTERGMALAIAIFYLITFLDTQAAGIQSGSVVYLRTVYGEHIMQLFIVGCFVAIWFLTSRTTISPLGLLLCMIWQNIYAVMVVTWFVAIPGVPLGAVVNHSLIAFFIWYLAHTRLERMPDNGHPNTDS